MLLTVVSMYSTGTVKAETNSDYEVKMPEQSIFTTYPRIKPKGN